MHGSSQTAAFFLNHATQAALHVQDICASLFFAVHCLLSFTAPLRSEAEVPIPLNKHPDQTHKDDPAMNSLKDILSHLTFRKACRLLGTEGEKLIRAEGDAGLHAAYTPKVAVGVYPRSP